MKELSDVLWYQVFQKWAERFRIRDMSTYWLVEEIGEEKKHHRVYIGGLATNVVYNDVFNHFNLYPLRSLVKITLSFLFKAKYHRYGQEILKDFNKLQLWYALPIKLSWFFFQMRLVLQWKLLYKTSTCLINNLGEVVPDHFLVAISC